MKMHLKLTILYVCSFIFSAAPIVITFIINREQYITTPADTFKLGLGGVIAITFVAFKAIGKLKMPTGIVLYAAIFALSYLLEALLADLLLISGMALLGEVIDAAVFRPLIKRQRESIKISKLSDATTEKVRAVLDEYMGR